MGIHKEVGDKTHKYKLDDKEYLRDENSGSNDEAHLQKSVEKFIEKLDIVSSALIRHYHFKKQSGARLTIVEEKQKDYMSILECREEIHTLEKQLTNTINEKLVSFEICQKNLQSSFVTLRSDTENQIKNL